MSDSPTLNSRLRILVAKTFRAEKLYSSIRTNATQAASVSNLSEIANDIRAQVWQRCHYKLRTALNDILAIGSNTAVAAEVLALREHFRQQADQSTQAMLSGLEALDETAKRQEFARTLKLSVELIRHKAGAQANKVIADELAALLEATGRKAQLEGKAQRLRQKKVENGPSSQFSELDELSPPAPMPANVVSLEHRLVAGGRPRRR